MIAADAIDPAREKRRWSRMPPRAGTAGVLSALWAGTRNATKCRRTEHAAEARRGLGFASEDCDHRARKARSRIMQRPQRVPDAGVRRSEWPKHHTGVVIGPASHAEHVRKRGGHHVRAFFL